MQVLLFDVAFRTVRANAAIRGYMLYLDKKILENHYEIRTALTKSVDDAIHRVEETNAVILSIKAVLHDVEQLVNELNDINRVTSHSNDNI